MEEEEDDEPLVVEIVAEPEFALEVRNSAGGGGKREGKGFVLPDVMGGVRGDGGEDL